MMKKVMVVLMALCFVGAAFADLSMYSQKSTISDALTDLCAGDFAATAGKSGFNGSRFTFIAQR